MLDTQLRKEIDWPLLLLVYLLAIFGVLIIFSATHSDPAAAFHKKQLLFIAIGTVALVGTTSQDYHVYSRFARHLYWLNMAFLLMVKFKGHTTNGSARWIRLGPMQFQPSEFAKLFVILTLSAFLARKGEDIKNPKTLIRSFLHVCLPMALIFTQPDLGTALVIIAIWFGMVYIAGARIEHIVAFLCAGLVLFGLMFFTGKIKKFQADRLSAWFLQLTDSKGAKVTKEGYHVEQARIAIGSGGLWGKGFLHSTQVRGGYVPEKQTDFIFTTIGEELGFVGATILLGIYGLLIWRTTRIVEATDEDLLGKLIAMGIITMLTFHILVNVGMNIGLVPVAGVPLPLISSGGSNMILTLASFGLLQSVLRHRHQLLF